MNGAGSTLEEIGFRGLEMADTLWRTLAVTADRQYRITALAAGVKYHELPPPIELPPPLRIRTGDPEPEQKPEPTPVRQATPAEIIATFDAARGKG